MILAGFPLPEPTAHECQKAFDQACAECVSHDATCGVRCSVCDERMCAWFGPEPAVNTCAAHDDECRDCHGENRCRACAAVRRAA